METHGELKTLLAKIGTALPFVVLGSLIAAVGTDLNLFGAGSA